MELPVTISFRVYCIVKASQKSCISLLPNSIFSPHKFDKDIIYVPQLESAGISEISMTFQFGWYHERKETTDNCPIKEN